MTITSADMNRAFENMGFSKTKYDSWYIIERKDGDVWKRDPAYCSETDRFSEEEAFQKEMQAQMDWPSTKYRIAFVQTITSMKISGVE